MKTTLHYAKIQLLRVFRDPVTLIVLFTIPLVLLLLFGAFLGGGDNSVSLKVAVVNNSDEPFAQTFAKQLKEVEVFKQSDEKLSLDEAQQKLKDNQIDGVVELPANFGKLQQDGKPSGSAHVYVDQSDLSTGDIMMSVMNSVADQTNQSITGAEPPIQIERRSVSGTSTRVFDNLYAMFTAMAIMMVGIFGVASTIPSDKKTGILRRMRVTPFRSNQLIGGMVLAFLVISVLAVAMMTVVAKLIFNMEMHGSWLDFSLFVLIGSLLMIAMGVMVGGWAKNTTQSDIYGQIIFIGNLAFSGLWMPRALMPEWLQGVTAYLPLTPLIEGLGRIVTEGVGLASLGFQLAVIAGWFVVVFIVSIKTFRWE